MHGLVRNNPAYGWPVACIRNLLSMSLRLLLFKSCYLLGSSNFLTTIELQFFRAKGCFFFFEVDVFYDLRSLLSHSSFVKVAAGKV